MPRFIVEIVYETQRVWSEEESRWFDPPANQDDQKGRRRLYRDVIVARSEREAFVKALAARREAHPARRFYDWSVVSHNERPAP